MSVRSEAASTGFPILGILGLIFIVLKLTGVIAWSWWWVLAPFLVPAALGVIILVVFIVGMVFATRNGGNPWR